jgi:predicted house-cleaning noncanonical NTP pyrophosphatase (MazG superfamily)
MGANLSKNTLEEINKHIPVSRRSKLLSQYIVDGLYTLPDSKEEIQEIIEWKNDDEMVIVPMFFAEEAAAKIDALLEELKGKVEKYDLYAELGRSMILRAITKNFAEYVKLNPIENPEKKFFIVEVPVGTKERIGKHIDKMERSSTINQFILDEYKPINDVDMLKKRLPVERERLSILIELDVVDYAEDVANRIGQKVKITHIIRNAISQLVERLESEQPKKHDLENKLTRTLEEIAKHASPNEIRELLEKYAPKDDSSQYTKAWWEE